MLLLLSLLRRPSQLCSRALSPTTQPTAILNTDRVMLLDELPDDARLLVLQHLPIKSLVACEAVSKTLKFFATQNEVWKPRCHEYWWRDFGPGT